MKRSWALQQDSNSQVAGTVAPVTRRLQASPGFGCEQPQPLNHVVRRVHQRPRCGRKTLERCAVERPEKQVIDRPDFRRETGYAMTGSARQDEQDAAPVLRVLALHHQSLTCELSGFA